MLKVGTADLKNRLSFFLRKVRKGSPVIVTNRGVPIAKIVPVGKYEESTLEEKLAAMAAEGTLEYRTDRKPLREFEPIDLGGNYASESIIRDREDR